MICFALYMKAYICVWQVLPASAPLLEMRKGHDACVRAHLQPSFFRRRREETDTKKEQGGVERTFFCRHEV